MKLVLKAPETKRLKLKHYEPPKNAFKINLRRYNEVLENNRSELLKFLNDSYD